MSTTPKSQLMMASTREIEKYIKYLFYKTAQVVVQSRLGGKQLTESLPRPQNQSWFCLAINDNTEISHEAKKTSSFCQLSGNSLLCNPLCIEISLKTSEGETLVLENWVMWLKKEGIQQEAIPIRLGNTVYNHMGLLLKSALCVTRAVPSYKLSRRQGPETFVMCYRIYSGEPSTNQLGHGFQSCQIGQVTTPMGHVALRVDYRTQMTISPSSSSLSMEPYCVQPILVKSDHFSDLESTTKTISTNNAQQKNNSESSEQAGTSDESLDAMKLFAASPPDCGTIQAHFATTANPFNLSPRQQHFSRRLACGDYYSSNESLGRKLSSTSLRPRSGTNQSVASDDNDSEHIKFGAFSARKVSVKDSDSVELDLFTVDVDPKDNSPSLDKQMDKLTLNKSPPAKCVASGAAKKLVFDDTSEATAKPAPVTDCIMLNFKAPFSGPKSSESDNYPLSSTSDLGIFFKKVSMAPSLGLQSNRQQPEESDDLSLSDQLQHLNEDLATFESHLGEYDSMLKNMDTASESE